MRLGVPGERGLSSLALMSLQLMKCLMIQLTKL